MENRSTTTTHAQSHPFTVLQYPESSCAIILLPLPFGVSFKRYVKSFNYVKPRLTCHLAPLIPNLANVLTDPKLHSIRVIPDGSLFDADGHIVRFDVPFQPESLKRIGKFSLSQLLHACGDEGGVCFRDFVHRSNTHLAFCNTTHKHLFLSHAVIAYFHHSHVVARYVYERRESSKIYRPPLYMASL